MNPIDKDMQTKWVGLKAGISELRGADRWRI
jgi:hypothetical protein